MFDSLSWHLNYRNQYCISNILKTFFGKDSK
jgi:hypothetical protein